MTYNRCIPGKEIMNDTLLIVALFIAAGCAFASTLLALFYAILHWIDRRDKELLDVSSDLFDERPVEPMPVHLQSIEVVEVPDNKYAGTVEITMIDPTPVPPVKRKRAPRKKAL
jgi:hypothetical protein